jgi:predicted flap endonuclease-1-like 5' DNA nuclease
MKVPGGKRVTSNQRDLQESDFLNGLAMPARRALLGAGYTRLDQLAAVSERELKKLHGMGPKAIDQLRRALDAQGLSFAEERSTQR